MSERRVKELKALEVKLLAERDLILRRQREHLGGPSWPREEVRALSERQDALQAELTRLRERLRAAERGEDD